MLVYQLMAELSMKSRQHLREITATSPFHLELFPVEVAASTSPLAEQTVNGVSTATTLGLAYPFDESTNSSPAILLLQSDDLKELNQQVAQDRAWPYEYQPYLRLSLDSVPRRRHFISFLNSISDTLARNPIVLEFDSFFYTANDYVAPPFQAYFQDFRLAV